MTRIRVLMRAIKLLENGYIPYDHLTQARTVDDQPVSYLHPEAAKFTATGAVVRAIYELTGDPADQRDRLWDETLREFKQQYGGWFKMYVAFEQMNKEQVLEIFKNKLMEWNS
jgi:hypothetical protein